MVAGEDDDGVVFLAGFFQSIKDFAYLPIHECDRGIVAANGFLLAAYVHFHVNAGLVVDSWFRDVVPVAISLFRQDHAVVREVVIVVLARRDEGHMGPHESDCYKERLVFVLFD